MLLLIVSFSILILPVSSFATEIIVNENEVEIFMTSTEKSKEQIWFKEPQAMENQLTKKANIPLQPEDANPEAATIKVVPAKTYQKVIGVGISLEESTVNNLSQMDPTKRKEVLQKLVDPKNGAGMTLFRLTIGTSDFTGKAFYTYYDIPPQGEPDWYNVTGKGFSIQKDKDYQIIETVKDIQQVAQEYGVADQIKFFASSWTPPGWMKSSTALSWLNWTTGRNPDGLLAGSFNPTHVNDFAMYLTRFVEEYQKLGIPIYALTIQNEPYLETLYPSSLMSGQDNGKVVIQTKKDLQAKGLTTKIWAFDHNFADGVRFMKDFNSVPGALDAIDSIAFHDYAGEPAEMSKVLQTYKSQKADLSVSLSERSVWGTEGADRLIQYFRKGASSYNSWVTMLDSNVAPNKYISKVDPTLLGRKANDSSIYWEMPEFFILGQFARFIRPDTVRIESNYGSKDTVTNVSFYDPNTKSIVLVVANQTNKEQPVVVQDGHNQFKTTLPAKNVASNIWQYE